MIIYQKLSFMIDYFLKLNKNILIMNNYSSIQFGCSASSYSNPQIIYNFGFLLLVIIHIFRSFVQSLALVKSYFNVILIYYAEL